MVTFLWTWSGISFGYRDGDHLWTYDGRHVGRFIGDAVYGHGGRYLGEVRFGARLLTARSGASMSIAAFDSLPNRGAVERGADSAPLAMELRCKDFPAPEQLDP
jgi:hypothetical protein